MSIAARMPGAAFRPISYRAEAGTFTSFPRGWIEHVVVGNGSPWGYFEGLKYPNRKFSTFWASKVGVIEQYTETYRESWAQASGNGMYWSVETEGFPDELLTQRQIVACAKIHNFLQAPDRLANAVGEYGIGTHSMGGIAWGGHACPGPLRAGQRMAIIAMARMMRGDSGMWVLYNDGTAAQWIDHGDVRRHVSAAEFNAVKAAGVNVVTVTLPADDPFWDLTQV